MRKVLPPLLASLLLSCLLSLGCSKSPEPAKETEVIQADIPDPLTLLVVDEPDLGQRLARQWSARRDGELTVINRTSQEMESSGFEMPENVDVVVYPPSMMGELVSRERLRALPNDFLTSDGYNRNELLRHFRMSVVRHRNDSWAVPLGSPNFAMLINREIASDFKPPETWDQVDRFMSKVASSIESSSAAGNVNPKVDMPLAPGWAVQTMLARVAPSVCFRGTLSTVFDRRTMDPLIAAPPFVEALEQLVAIASERSIESDPAGVFQLSLSGKNAIAFSWPALGFSMASENLDERESTPDSGGGDDESGSSLERLKIYPLPGTERWYDQKSRAWNKRSSEEDKRVDLIGFSGLVASMAVGGPHERTAWEFLEWLPDKSISKVTMVASPLVGPFRASHLGDMNRWTGDAISEEVAFEYADVISANHDRNMVMMFPRIPGYNQYLEALDEAVRAAVMGQQSPQAALDDAAKRWNEITDSIGREKQISNLRRESGY